MKKQSIGVSFHNIYDEIRKILFEARAKAWKAVNSAMVEAYWNVGRLIVEKEQVGKKRAAYGEAVLADISSRLTEEFGKGFDLTNLRKMRQFYLTFPKRDAARLESTKSQKRDPLRSELSWSHYRLLLRVENEQARLWYINEAADQRSSTRQLERQINAFYYERLNLSL